MKILRVIPTINKAAGGPVEGLTQQGIAMVAAGHEVHTLSCDAPGQEVDERLRSNTLHFMGPSTLGYGYTARLEPWLRENAAKYDVIIIHGMWTYHSYCTAKVARSLGLRYVVILHGMLDPWFARQYPLKHLKKWLYWPWAEYRTLRDAWKILFTTEEELYLARKSFWLYKVREKLVGYGIAAPTVDYSKARGAFLQDHPALADSKNFLYLSRLHAKKGCDLLIEAFAKVVRNDHRATHTHLIMAGPGDASYIRDLQDQCTRLGIRDRVSFTGMLTGDHKWGAYASADVFVLPSHQENFGIVIAEALASGVPVLTTFQVNIWREIQKSGAGIINSDTQQGTDKLLATWLGMDESSRFEMRRSAHACFEQYFNIQRVTKNLLDTLQEVAASPVPGAHTFQGSLLKK